nr:hypothetical protein CFP56_43777 [Quercus suber]
MSGDRQAPPKQTSECQLNAVIDAASSVDCSEACDMYGRYGSIRGVHGDAADDNPDAHRPLRRLSRTGDRPQAHDRSYRDPETQSQRAVDQVFNVGAGVAISIAANNGFGTSTDINALQPDKIEAVEKSTYAWRILYVPTVACAKLSIVVLLRLLFISKNHQLANNIVGIFIAVQLFSFTLATCFTCDVPATWAITSGRCFDMIITDIALIIMPFFMVANIQMPVAKKAIVVGCFGFRIIDIGASAAQLAYTNRLDITGPVSAAWPWYFIGQVVQTATIISSCVPYLRQLLQAFPSGMFQTDEIRRRGLTYTDRVHGYAENSSHSYVLHNVEDVSSKAASLRNVHASVLGSSDWEGQRATTTIESNGRSNSTVPSITGDQVLSVHMSRSVEVKTQPRD